jgi:excisionase family DNA binding protein
VSVPPDVEQAIDKRSGMAAVGNLTDFIKYQLAQGLETGGPRVAGLGAEMAVGAAVAQQMINQPGPNGGGALDVLTPADAAKILSVSEADVLTSLDAGELKGRRIGSQWRVTRAAIDQFMR